MLIGSGGFKIGSAWRKKGATSVWGMFSTKKTSERKRKYKVMSLVSVILVTVSNMYLKAVPALWVVISVTYVWPVWSQKSKLHQPKVMSVLLHLIPAVDLRVTRSSSFSKNQSPRPCSVGLTRVKALPAFLLFLSSSGIYSKGDSNCFIQKISFI